ncbi:hypothetical protein Bbelb_415400 [Branchiostoma belcheri]|nr:hypothetical protein Bbelb_415400 [Branchiostoma belcheri]
MPPRKRTRRPTLGNGVPTIAGCPNVIQRTLHPGQTRLYIGWQLDVYDNSYGNIGLHDKDGLEPYHSSGRIFNFGDYFELGTYMNSYTARNYRGQTATCTVEVIIKAMFCPSLPQPTDGYITCSHGEAEGSTCRYRCQTGYTATSGNEVRACINGYWTGSPIVCSIQDCGQPPPAPPNSRMACTRSTFYGSICTYECEDGYFPANYNTHGPSVQRSCLATRMWTTMNDTNFACADGEAPVFNSCPSPISARAEKGTVSAIVSWTAPEASDNSNDAVEVSQTVGQPPAPKCSALTNPLHGSIACDNQHNYGSTCNYICEEGYYLNGDPTTRCELDQNVDVTNWTPLTSQLTCLPVQCPQLPTVQNGGLLVNTTCNNTFGSYCYFQCDPGFMLQGDGSVLCNASTPGQSTGAWEGNPPTCIEASCAPLGPIANGRIIFDQSCPFGNVLPPGSVCGAACRPGYVLLGASALKCRLDGTWNTSLPSCEVITCDSAGLPEPQNGYKIGCSNSLEPHGTTCIIGCNAGYQPAIPVQRTCIEDGNEIKCTHLPKPNNGNITSCYHGSTSTEPEESQSVGAECAAFCNEGYTAAGSTERTCLPGGIWNGTELRCRDVTPPVLQCPDDIQLVANEGQDTATVDWYWEPVIAKDAGRDLTSVLSGSTSRVAELPEGRHSFTYEAADGAVNRASCTMTVDVRVIRCPGLPSVVNGVTELVAGKGTCSGGSVQGSQCKVTCDAGYSMADGSTVTTRSCQRAGNATLQGGWTGSVPLCTGVTCPLPTVVNGFVFGCNPPNALYGSTCEFHCNRGYMGSTNETTVTRTCTANGTFTGESLLCDPIKCSGLTSVEHGQVIPASCLSSSVSNGEVCIFNCDPGYSIVGPFSKQCLPDGRWSDTRKTSCKDHEPPRFTGQCPIYTNAVGDAGKTSATVIFTEPVATDNSGNVNVTRAANQKGPGDAFPEGTTVVTYSAKDAADNRAQCDVFVVVRVHRCPMLQAPTSGSVNCSGDYYGSKCQYRCNEGYTLNGSPTRHCVLSQDGSSSYWNGSQPACRAVECPAMVTPVNAVKSGCFNEPPATERFGTVCSFYCNYGYRGSGDNNARCLSDGSWSSSNFVCDNIERPHFSQCPQDKTFYADRSSQSTFVYWTVLATDNSGETPVVACSHAVGMFPSGDHQVSCTATDGSGNTETCSFDVRVKVRRCDQLLPPLFGSFVGTCDTAYGSVCRVTCTTGYQLEGSETATCEIQGNTAVWDRATNPVCKVATHCRHLQMLACFHQTVPGRVTFTGGHPAASPVGQATSCKAMDERFCVASMERGIEMPAWFQVDVKYGTITDSSFLGASVSFDIPRATDNSDETLNVTKRPVDITSPYNFTVDTVVTYEFHDSGGNSATCTFIVYIKGELPPNVVFCPDDLTITATDRLAEVSWPEPVFDDPTGSDLDVSSNIANNGSLPWGDHSVTYTATNLDNGKSATCVFLVIVRPVACPPLNPPRFGALACDTWVYGKFCSMFCDAQHDIPRGTSPGDKYICGASGIWSPPPPVPDCVNRYRPNRFVLPSELHYFSGDCSDPSVQADIAQRFVTILNGSDFGSACSDSVGCSWENVEVTCGANVRWRSLGRQSKLVTGQPMDGTSRSSGQFSLTMTFSLVVNMTDDDPSVSSVDRYYTADDQLLMMTDVIQAEIYSGDFDINVPGLSVQVDQNSLTYGWSELDCPKGYSEQPDSMNCVGCSTGTYYDEAADDCLKCSIGLYQDEEAQFQCKTCPPGTLTIDVGARNLTECLDICSVGSYSNTRVVPCTKCDVGYYQDQEGQTSCNRCNVSLSTLTIGSISESDCKEFCQAGSYSDNGFVPCLPCPRRYYQPSMGQQQCLTCPGMTTTLSEGALSLASCVEFDACASAPCANGGVCNRLIEGYTCTCASGYGGDSCEVNINDCVRNPCLNNGTCVDGVNSYTCLCSDGYTGKTCQEDIDDCQPPPCYNNGTCEDRVGGFACHCQPGFIGAACEITVDACFQHGCMNGATCVGKATSYDCVCPDGFTGDMCETNVDDCRGNPCLHNGVCVDGVMDFTCLCTMGYSGSLCEVDLDLCASMPCVNNSTCVDLGDDYACKCVEGLAGKNCESPRDPCSYQPCLNGGSCIEQLETVDYTCSCAQGFAGIQCEVNVDECASGPCSNGAICIDGINHHTCVCPPGFYGSNCGATVDHCASAPCMNNSTCLSELDGYHCICPPSATGMTCETPVDPCTSAPCANNGSCVVEDSGYSCHCGPDFTGTICDAMEDSCKSDPCANGGICTDGFGTFSCVCLDGYAGQACEHELDECISNPCENSGVCVDKEAGYTCYEGHFCESEVNECAIYPCKNARSCQDLLNNYECECEPGWTGFTGHNCEVNIDECLSEPCSNGGQCIDQSDGYNCVCPEGYTGRMCDININECIPNKCENGATCVDGVGDYMCVCNTGFSGAHCEVNINDCASSLCENYSTCLDGINSYTCLCPPGYSGLTCEIDFDIKVTAADNNHFSESSANCADGRWHHVAVSYQHASEVLSLYVDGVEANSTHVSILQESFQVQAFAVAVATGVANAYEGEFKGDISQVNAWARSLSHSEVLELSGSCQTKSIADTVAWSDFVVATQTNPQYGAFSSPSSCDSKDQCESSPCSNGGTCGDGILSFTCTCPQTHTGHLCEIQLDPCDGNLCQNDAACQADMTSMTYTCRCPAGFSGDLCNVLSIDGGWSEWSRWSACTATCGNSTHSRQRLCNNPPPLGGGNPCTGASLEIEACGNIPDCSECIELQHPENGYLVCSKDGEDTKCEVYCRAGFMMVVDPDLYVDLRCGPSTWYTWTHQDIANLPGRIPGCTRKELPTSVNLDFVIRYKNVTEDPFAALFSGQQNPIISYNHDVYENAFSLVVTQNLVSLKCITSQTCHKNGSEVRFENVTIGNTTRLDIVGHIILTTQVDQIPDPLPTLAESSKYRFPMDMISGDVVAGNPALTSFGNPSLIDGISGKAISLDGQTQYLNAGQFPGECLAVHGNLPALSSDGHTQFFIGAPNNMGNPSASLLGHADVDDIIFWDRGLSSGEIRDLMSSEPVAVAKACRGQHLTLNCRSEEVITIHSATLGILTPSLCGALNSSQMDSCVEDAALEYTINLCNGQRNCHLHVTNDVFDDACLQTRNVLEVLYSCDTGRFSDKDSIMENIMDVWKETTESLTGMVESGDFDLHVILQNIPAEKNNTEEAAVQLICTDNMVGLEICGNCSAGSYRYSPTECYPCDFGTFQEKEGQDHCNACPSGKTTFFTGARTSSDCVGAIPEPDNPNNL